MLDSYSHVASRDSSAATLANYGCPSVSHSSHSTDQVLGSTITPGLDTHPITSSTQRSSPSASTPSSSSAHAQSHAASRREPQSSKPATASSGSRKGVSTDDAGAEKRRRNTLAARRFRQKQHDRVSQLEQTLEEISKERDDLKMQVARWEGEATALRAMLAESSSR